jgi:hypothetical protein
MTAAQIIALAVLAFFVLGIALAELDAWAGRVIDRHVEAAFDTHADDALDLCAEPPLYDTLAAVLAPQLIAEAEALTRGAAS